MLGGGIVTLEKVRVLVHRAAKKSRYRCRILRLT
jgi:hypothetical protein